MSQPFWLFLIAMLPVAVAELRAARREESRCLFVAILVLIVVSLTIRLYAMGPHGSVVALSPANEILVPLFNSFSIAVMVTVLILAATLLIGASTAAMGGDGWSSLVRVLLASPFLVYPAYALWRLHDYQIQVWNPTY